MDKAAARMDLAGRQARMLDRALSAQRKAAIESAGASITLAKADKILEEAEHGLRNGALEAEFALKRQERAAKIAGAGTARAGAEAGAAGGLFGKLGGGAGMGAAIGAGIALSPVIATLGSGLLGLGAAAYGVSKNAKLMRQATAPLKADVASFQEELQPVVLADFAGAARFAAHVLGDLEPVSAATGAALG